jgi:hypothetical protein
LSFTDEMLEALDLIPAVLHQYIDQVQCSNRKGVFPLCGL